MLDLPMKLPPMVESLAHHATWRGPKSAYGFPEVPHEQVNARHLSPSRTLGVIVLPHGQDRQEVVDL